MANPFVGIIDSQFKQTFKDAIDAILAETALTVPCTIQYGSSNNTLCPNCVYDPISQRSLNKYNGSGSNPFTTDTICPVCNGYGMIDKSTDEIIHLAVIFDSKYWLNWNNSNNSIHITSGMVQTICSIELLPKIKNAQSITMNNNIKNYGGYLYNRAGEPEPCGLGDHNYIITMWKLQ